MCIHTISPLFFIKLFDICFTISDLETNIKTVKKFGVFSGINIVNALGEPKNELLSRFYLYTSL